MPPVAFDSSESIDDIIGSVYTCPLTEADGISTQGYGSRNKIFVVLGRNEANGTFYGCVLVNSRKRLASGQYPISTTDYPEFLTNEDDSFIDGSQIKEFPQSVIDRSTYKRKLKDIDIGGLMEEIQESTTISDKIKKRYGIIDV